MSKIVGIIPARYGSTRFPAKALVDIEGKTMIQRVYEQASKSASLEQVVVATDHEKIFTTVKRFGGEVVMTSTEHPSGTDRCQEALEKLDQSYEYVINIQGDEPFIKPEQIENLAELLDGNTQLATLVTKVHDPELLWNPNIMKVIFDKNMQAIYFSRECIPYIRGVAKQDWINQHTFYKHICIYAYRADILREITRLKISTLEKAESLEQLRWIENGFTIRIGITEHESISIDTPEDLERALGHC
ncbi:MAG: 3-deoxy-manno-octulosonate cytidylyltransferase [Candidatus Cyclobacteriaceae bacterium M3_2C_046]